MPRPVNIFLLSRVGDEEGFNTLMRHEMGLADRPGVRGHEIGSLRIVAEAMLRCGAGIGDLDGFFFSYSIPHIGKEFDLLKVCGDAFVNIELKSEGVPEERILAQLVRNRYYLRSLGRKGSFFSVVTDTMECFRLGDGGGLERVPFSEAAEAVLALSGPYAADLDGIFVPANFLVSPLGSPERFLRSEYFLTVEQEEIRRKIFESLERHAAEQGGRPLFMSLRGRTGTGKTLLLYDMAKKASERMRTAVLHCTPVPDTASAITEALGNLRVLSSGSLAGGSGALDGAEFILVDEAQRMDLRTLELISDHVRRHGLCCLFCLDPDQVLRLSEMRLDMEGRIAGLAGGCSCELHSRIRTNREILKFIDYMLDLSRTRARMSFEHISLEYANTKAEASLIVEYYRARGYVFLDCSAGEDGTAEGSGNAAGREFDSVVTVMNGSFYYEDKKLCGRRHPDRDLLYPNLFYRNATRARSRLCIVVTEAPELFRAVSSLLEP